MSDTANDHREIDNSSAPQPRKKVAFGDFLVISLILFLLLTFMPVRFWVVETVNNFIHWMLLPSLFIVPYMLVKRNWIRGILWGIPAVAFFLLFGELFLPAIGQRYDSGPDSESTRLHLEVMTYNMFAGRDTDRQSQIDMIRAEGADIVALQELRREAASVIEAELGNVYPYMILSPTGLSGSGILSKYPIVDSEVIEMSGLGNIRASIDIGIDQITVVSAHPPPAVFCKRLYYYPIALDVINTLACIATEGEPTILLGDFNITDQSTGYRILKNAGLRDVHREVGWGFGFTWPEWIPLLGWRFIPIVRIDYVCHTEEFIAERIHTGPATASDHRPVIADILYRKFPN